MSRVPARRALAAHSGHAASPPAGRIALALAAPLLAIAPGSTATSAAATSAAATASDDLSDELLLAGIAEEDGPRGLAGQTYAPRSRQRRPEETPPPEPGTADEDLAAWRAWLVDERMLGTWGGLRDDAEARGIELDASAVFDFGYVLDGGVRTGGSDVRAFDFNVTIDLGKLGVIDGVTLFMDAYSISRGSISADVGDAQGVSNLETGFSVDQIAELWAEWWLLDDHLRIKVGKIEANSEFAFVEGAGEFLNSSAGFSPTIAALPSWPDPATGVVLYGYPGENFSIGFGAFDGATAVDGVRTGNRGPSTFFSDDLSDDWFLALEANATWAAGEALAGVGPGRFGLGAWHHTGDWARFVGGGTKSGTTGFYAVLEQRLVDRDDSDPDAGGLDFFAQYGWADGDVVEFEQHVALGLALAGTFPGRDDDAAGLYVSRGFLSPESGAADDETVVELMYKFQATGFAALKPSLQWVDSPGGDPTIDDALVAILRLEISF